MISHVTPLVDEVSVSFQDLSQRGMTLIDFGRKLPSSVDNKGNKRQVKIAAKNLACAAVG